MEHSDSTLAREAPLREAELSQALALSQEAGWNQIEADWRIFVDFGTVYAARDAGRVVATAATLPYGGRFAWISMVLVAQEYQRRGLARRLMARCVRELTASGLVPVLDATPAGRTVYQGLGFRDTWGFQRLACRAVHQDHPPAAAPAGATLRPVTDADWAQLCAYDAACFGADRSTVLGRVRGRVPAADYAVFRQDRIAGFLLGRDGQAATQLGPLVADDEATALTLLDHGLRAVGGPIYIDLVDWRPAVHAWLVQRGFEVQRPFTRMVYGRSTGFDEPRHLFAVAGPELG